MPPIPNDPVIDDLREARHAISARRDHAPKKLIAYYMEMPKRY